MKLAVIGCGAIFRGLHAPALARIEDVEVTWLVDESARSLDAAKALYPKARTASKIDDVDGVDAVLIATPNTLHYAQAKHALSRGWHAFIEKPLAVTRIEADELVKLAAERKLACAVNVNRRFLPNVVALKAIIDRGDLGTIKRIAVTDGVRSSGTAEGGLHYQGSKTLAGGGVLIDTGSHMLDLPLYLGGARAVAQLDYRDDGETGIEAECKFDFTAEGERGSFTVSGFLSRISAVPQSVVVDFEQARVSVPLAPPGSLSIRFHDKPSLATEVPVPIPADVFVQSFADSFRSFYDAAMRGGEGAENSAVSIALTVETIERCYATRNPIAYTWNYEQPSRTESIAGKTIGVVGAGGFLGTRVCEMVMDSGGVARPITHSTHGSFSLLRTTNDVHIGDASSEDFLARALRGADAVVNCAINMKGTRKFAIAATRDIARAVARTCGELGIKRLVHISTLAVHGVYLGREGEPLREDPFRSAYAVAKLESERDVIEECAKNGVEAVILRMGHIYGPYALGWTAGQYDLVASNKLVRVEEWRNPSNTVFVDNAVDAIFAAMTAPNVAGKTFYITDVPNHSWSDFYKPLFDVAGCDESALEDLSYDEFAAIFSDYTRSPLKQGMEIAGRLGRQAFGRETLKDIKNNPKYTRFFDTLQTIVPQSMFSALTNTLKNRAPAAAGGGGDVASIFSYLCSYASSAKLPVEDAVRELGYKAPYSGREAADATAAWLRFVDIR